MVLAVGFGGVGMKRGEALGQLLDEGQLVGVTFTDVTSRQSMGPPFVIRGMLSRSERGGSRESGIAVGLKEGWIKVLATQ